MSKPEVLLAMAQDATMYRTELGKWYRMDYVDAPNGVFFVSDEETGEQLEVLASEVPDDARFFKLEEIEELDYE